jgi:hypothetical protein
MSVKTIDYQYLNEVSGLDTQDGYSWGQAVKTWAHIRAKMGLALTREMTVFFSDDGITSDIDIVNFGLQNFGILNLVGNTDIWTFSSTIQGNSGTVDPIIKFTGGGTVNILNAILACLTDNKLGIDIDPGIPESVSLSIKESVIWLYGKGVSAFHLGDFLGIHFNIDNVLFVPIFGVDYTGSSFIYSDSPAPSMMGIPLFSNCAFVYNQAGGPFPESQVLTVAGGAYTNCQFYNCMWVEYNSITGAFTIDTTPYAHPSTAPVALRDPKPMTSSDMFRILPYLKLDTRSVVGGTVVTDKTETEAAITASQGVITGAIATSETAIRGADADDLKDLSDQVDGVVSDIATAVTDIKGLDDRDNTEIYNKIIAVVGGIEVVIDVPEKLIRPVTGSAVYRIALNIYDNEGNPEAPDVDPTIKITNRDESVVRVVETGMSGVAVGQYYYDYTITSTSTVEKESVIIKIIEGGITTYHREVTEIYEEGGQASGAGSYPVDHNYGSVDALRICEAGVVPDTGIGGVWIYAYLKTDFDAGLRGEVYRKGLSHTNDDGMG